MVGGPQGVPLQKKGDVPVVQNSKKGKGKELVA